METLAQQIGDELCAFRDLRIACGTSQRAGEALEITQLPAVAGAERRLGRFKRRRRLFVIRLVLSVRTVRLAWQSRNGTVLGSNERGCDGDVGPDLLPTGSA